MHEIGLSSKESSTNFIGGGIPVMDQINSRILVIDDDPEIVWYLSKLMEKFGFECETASGGEEGLTMLEKGNFDLVVLDITMPGMTGIDVLKQINERGIKVPVIILSAYESVGYAVETTKLGAYDYLVKPVNEEKLRITVQNALKTRELETEVKILRKKLKVESDEIEFISNDPAVINVLETVRKIANYDVSVLVIGESGTGKELIAKIIHKNSRRSTGAFISIDCATLPENLVESELFGHEKGAFTGANEAKTGRLELANGGTLFLDEIGNLSVNTQKKLLRVLQERKIMRIGGKKTIDLDIRIITATNVDLKESVKKGEFRDDLYHRLNEFYIEIPPLRDRSGDTDLLASHFILFYSRKFSKKVDGISEEVSEMFKKYSWPGNVREFENSIKHSLIMADGIIKKENLPKSLLDGMNAGNAEKESSWHASDADENMSLKEACGKARETIEREMILKALEKYKFNKTKVAEVLQVDYKTLYNKMKEYGL